MVMTIMIMTTVIMPTMNKLEFMTDDRRAGKAVYRPSMDS
jgi:hypothetical protein